MYFLIDESNQFVFETKPSLKFGIALVAGIMLPYEARRQFLKRYSNLKKETRNDPRFVDQFLDDLIKWKVQGTLIIGDRANITLQDAEKFRSQFLAPLYAFADREPSQRKTALYEHLDNLAGKGASKFSIQDFSKILIILDTICELIAMYLKSISKLRSVDLRKIKLIIDDQCKAARFTLEHGFIHFFLNCRAREGRFSYQFGISKEFEYLYTRTEGEKKYFDSTKFLKNILNAEQGNMDDKHPELKIADILANSAQKFFKNTLSKTAWPKLLKIFNHVDYRHFNSEKLDIEVKLPDTLNKDSISQFLASTSTL